MLVQILNVVIKKKWKKKKMIKLGLIGYPLSHSLSAVIQNSALKALNIDAEYQILETEPESLVDRIKYLRSRDFLGFNVTIPLKVPITLFLTHVDAVANIAGCANTVKILPDKSMIGYNTDVYGFQKAIDNETKNLIKNSKVSIVGAGGAARACAVALAQSNVTEMDFYVRNIINASNTVNIIRDNFPDISINLKQIQNLNDLSDSKMLVNTTPLGMRGKAMDLSPVTDKILKTMPKDSTVYDIVYNPVNTILIQQAKANALKTITGLDMLIFQAAKAIEIWTGKVPDTSLMKIAALESLNT